MMNLKCLAVAMVVLTSAVGFAQDEEEVEVDMAMPGASVNVTADDGMGTSSVNMNVNMQMPGVQMKVKQTTRTTTTTTTTEEAPAASNTVIIRERRAPPTVIIREAAPPPVVYRDCGTGNDPGCAMARGGQWAMDAETFRGFLTALKADSNELTREEVCETMFSAHFITALQLSQVLDLFRNELTRLDVAKLAAPRVVNPSHALGHAAKWKNGLLGKDYTQLMVSQR